MRWRERAGTLAARVIGLVLPAALLISLLYGLNGLAHRLDRTDDENRLRVALFINGTLGDKSFFDAAARGVRGAATRLPLTARVVEGGTDPARWQAALTDLADSGDYDVVIAGTFTMVPYVEQLAQRFPHTRFIVYDATVDYARCGCRNVYSMRFRQNEGAYLAGFLAARLLQRGLPGIPAGSGAGIVGGMQFPVIEDFIVGFTGGVRDAAPGMSLQTQYANAFSDPAAGKEIAKIQYARGAGIIFHAAGATGQGVNEAAEETHRYAIGVDMDQYALYQARHPARAAAIVTSVLKDVDVGLERALRLTLAGQLGYGTTESLGLAEGGVRLAPHSAVLANAPPALLAELAERREAIAAGRVHVPTAFGAERP